MGLILTVVGALIGNNVCYGLGQECFHFPHAFLNLLNRQISIAENDLILFQDENDMLLCYATS